MAPGLRVLAPATWLRSALVARTPHTPQTLIAPLLNLRGLGMVSQQGSPFKGSLSRVRSPYTVNQGPEFSGSGTPRGLVVPEKMRGREGFQVRASSTDAGSKKTNDKINQASVSSSESTVPHGATASGRLNAEEQDKNSVLGKALIPVHLLAFALVAFPPESLFPEGSLPQLPTSDLSFALGLTLVALGAPMGVQAVYALRKSLTPFPEPTEDAVLQTDGAYSFVRHPMYSAQVLIGAGLTLATGSPVRLFFAVLLTLALDTKSKIEEGFLVEKFGDTYVEYSKAVKRLIPFVF